MDLQPYTMTGRVRRNYNSKQTSSPPTTTATAAVEPQVENVVRVGDNGCVDATVSQSSTEQHKESASAEVVVTEVVEEVVTQEADTGTVFEEETSTLILVAGDEKSYEVGPGMVILFTREDDTSDMSRMIYVTKEGFTDTAGNLIQEIVLENGNPLILPNRAKDETPEVIEVTAISETRTNESKVPDLQNDHPPVVITVDTSQDSELVERPNLETHPETLTEVEVETVSIPVPQPESVDHSQDSHHCDTTTSENLETEFTKLLPRSALKENSTLDNRTSQSSKLTNLRPPSSNISVMKQNFTRKIRREIDKPVVQTNSDSIQPIIRGPQTTVTTRKPMSVRRESRLLAQASSAIPVLPKRPISQLAASNLNEQNKVKFWLYDEEIKPLRKKPREPPQAGTKSKKRNLTKYIVGPASQFSLINRMEAAARSANEGPHSENKNPKQPSGPVILQKPVSSSVTADSSISQASQRLEGSPINSSQQCPVTYTRKPAERLPQDAVSPVSPPLPSTTDMNNVKPPSPNSIPEVNVQHQISKPQHEINGFSTPSQEDGEPSVVRGPPKKRVRFLDEAVKQQTPIISNEGIGVNWWVMSKEIFDRPSNNRTPLEWATWKCLNDLFQGRCLDGVTSNTHTKTGLRITSGRGRYFYHTRILETWVMTISPVAVSFVNKIGTQRSCHLNFTSIRSHTYYHDTTR